MTASSPLYVTPPLQSAVIGGRTQSWREAGAGGGLPLVLLHGIGSNARAWSGQFGAFSGERRVFVWNAPGYAGSDPLDADAPSPAEYAAAARSWLDHLGVSRFVLVGQSLGAIMATALATACPDRVAALVLASPAAGYGIAAGMPLPDGLGRRIADVATLGPVGMAAARYGRLLTDAASQQAHEIVHTAMSEIVPHGYEQAVRLLAGADLVRAVSELRVPTLTIWGGQDVVTPPAACRRVAEAVPHGEAIEIAGLGHAFATEAPPVFNEAIRSLLTKADRQQEAHTWI